MIEIDKFRPTTLRRRVLIALLAVATASLVTWSMTRKSGLVRNAARHPADVAVCAGGQTDDCVGSKTAVFAVPATPAALATAASSAVPPSPADIIPPASR
jgi:hypothetical protein